MFPHRTPMCAYNRSIDRTRSCFCFFLNRIIIINNNNYDNNVHCNHFNTNVETNLMMRMRTEALVCESMSVKRLLHLQQCACIYMSLCMTVCLYECLMRCVSVCARVCVSSLAGGQQAKQTQQNQTKRKTTKWNHHS